MVCLMQWVPWYPVPASRTQRVDAYVGLASAHTCRGFSQRLAPAVG